MFRLQLAFPEGTIRQKKRTLRKQRENGKGRKRLPVALAGIPKRIYDY